MIIKISRKIRVAISLLIIFSAIFAGYFVLRNYQRQAEASVSSKARFIGFPKMLFPPIDQSVVGWWKLNDAAGQTVVKDWTANANTGTSANNIVSATGYTGVANTAMSFNGTNDWVSVADSASLRGFTGLTISAWFNKVSKDIKIVGKWSGGFNYILRETSGVLQFYTYTSAQVGGNIGISPTIGWHHYIATWDGATMRAYKDGVVSATTYIQTGTISNTGSNLIIGADYDHLDPSNQITADVRIYNRALSAVEVKQLYMRGRP